MSGGSTPLACYQLLSAKNLDWQEVIITLTDERCVPVTHPDSNTLMIRNHMLVGQAAEGQFIDIREVDLTSPFDAVLVGMGEDGHFASIFPDSPQLHDALNLRKPPGWFHTTTSASEHERTSLNLSALIHTSSVILLAFGARKQAILNNPTGFPVAGLLEQEQTPVEIIWAP